MESVQARYKIYAPCAVIAEPRCLASKPFEQNPAQAPIPATTPLIRADRPLVNIIWLLNYEPGPLGRGACVVVRDPECRNHRN